MPWPLVIAGMAMGIALIMVQVKSPMLFAVGMYLPLATTFAIFVGGAARWVTDAIASRRNWNAAQRARVENIGGVKVGIVGIAGAEAAAAVGAKAGDPGEAARRDITELRRQGAEVVVLLAPVEKNVARRLARDAGADVVVLGRRVGAGMSRLERVGQTFLVAPADELQRVGRLEIVLRTAPHTHVVSRPDEVKAVKELKLRWHAPAVGAAGGERVVTTGSPAGAP